MSIEVSDIMLDLFMLLVCVLMIIAILLEINKLKRK